MLNQIVGRFTCNICGSPNDSSSPTDDRETANCHACRSSIRFRAVVLSLSRALFGMDLCLPDFPLLKSVRGMGFSDSDVYASRLQNRFDYTNTFYHRAPTFDIAKPDESEFGKYDFVICTEVLEHVFAPIELAFFTLARLLKPSGVLILTVPYSLDSATVEHFAGLGETGLAAVGGKTVLVNRSSSGEYAVFDQLIFHGGEGSTVEMRVFSEADLRAGLLSAGLSDVQFDSSGSRKHGVYFSNLCSLPIVARDKPFSLGGAGVNEIMQQLTAANALLREVKKSRWVRQGRMFGIGPDLPSPV